MWGSSAVGKLVKGAEPMKPGVEPFVDEEAGPDIAEKVRRRLQHFIDRKVAAQFEPLLAMARDETLTGLARGFAFRLVEGLGVIPRDAIATEVKELDQEAVSYTHLDVYKRQPGQNCIWRALAGSALIRQTAAARMSAISGLARGWTRRMPPPFAGCRGGKVWKSLL